MGGGGVGRDHLMGFGYLRLLALFGAFKVVHSCSQCKSLIFMSVPRLWHYCLQ